MNPILIAARLLIPLLILAYPLFGGMLAVALDNLDWHTMNLLGIPPIGNYQLVDKVLDIYYLAFLAIVTARFTNKRMRNILLGLFVFRVIGFFLFEFTQVRLFLFFFPNLFENLFFLYYLITKIAGYEPSLSHISVAILILTVAIPKMLQEYAIHIIDAPLVIHIGTFSFTYEMTWHQIVLIGCAALIGGFWYRKVPGPKQTL